MLNHFPVMIIALFLISLCVCVNAVAQTPETGKMMTRWAKMVAPDLPLPEYPRPTMVRPDWLNLNGPWQFDDAKDGEAPPLGRDLKERILVPFAPESRLSGIHRHAERVWYRRTFEVPAKWAGKRLMLHFGAVDWEARVWVNGVEMPVHKGGYDGFSFDITKVLKPSGPQEIVVGVYDPTDRGPQPRGKQVLKPQGIFYTPTTGIWQTVWLEPLPEAYIERYTAVPDIDAGVVRVKVSVAAMTLGKPVTVSVMDGSRKIGEATGESGQDIVIPVPNAKLWSPERPFLYGLRVSLSDVGKTIDSVRGYFGMRKISVGPDEKGVTRILLNNKFVFQMGPLDQGFWPDGIYTAPTEEALKYDIAITKKLGFNTTRKHVKVEPERWYYWCDKMGLLVWQDMPSGNNDTPEARKQYEAEMKAMITGRNRHPSIIMWVVFNEGWGQFDTERMTGVAKSLDPSRLASNASGWTDKGVGDLIDIHVYPGPGSPKPEATRAAVLGEFGGIGCYIEGHLWVSEHWGYVSASDKNDLQRMYDKLLRRVYQLKDTEGLSAAIYTEITDVERECNGLLTYDREVVKGAIDRYARANKGLLPPLGRLEMRLPTSEETGQTWKYMTVKPADNWADPDFDDSAWKSGPGGFGTKETPGAIVRTEWSTSDIWLRREFDWTPAGRSALELRLHHDEDTTVFINGKRVFHENGYMTVYDEYPLSREVNALLKKGRNVIAIHCRQTRGGQYIDAGIGIRHPVPSK